MYAACSSCNLTLEYSPNTLRPNHPKPSLVSIVQDISGLQAAFGPFMRIEQLIISTIPYFPSGAARPIVTDAYIKLLFDVQDEVEKLTAPVKVSEQFLHV